MANLLQISANEMKFLVKRSVEGLGFAPGDQMGAGVRAAACYQYGLANSRVIDEALSALKQDVQAPILLEKGDRWRFDAQGQTALVQAELAIGAALSHGAQRIRIGNLSQGVLVAPVLMAWLSKPMAQADAKQPVAMYYQHHSGAQRCLLLSAEGQPVGLYQPRSEVVAKDELLVQFGADSVDGHLISDALALAAAREQALEKGIMVDIDLVTRLKAMMMDSFVPESEASRNSGAGPG